MIFLDVLPIDPAERARRIREIIQQNVLAGLGKLNLW